METEAAIIEYNSCEDELYKEKLFRDKIYKPLDKLAENIINRFKFPYMDGGFEDIKVEVVSYLVLKLSNFTQEKGKSFSYFSVIAKNYLILQNNKRYKEEKRHVYFEDTHEDNYSLEETLQVDPEEEYHIPERVEFLHKWLDFWDDNLHHVFKKERDLKIAYAILELFKRAHMIENYNKKAFYLMVREITDYKTSYITKVRKHLEKTFGEQQEEYIETGTLSQDYLNRFMS